MEAISVNRETLEDYNPDMLHHLAAMRAALTDNMEAMKSFGVIVVTPQAFKDFSRHMWEQTRKPLAVYRGGRWRQMREPMRVAARLWAIAGGE